MVENNPKYCPRWSQITGVETECLKEECTRYVPAQEIDGKIVEGSCIDFCFLDFLSSLVVSLGVISGQVVIDYSQSQENEESPSKDDKGDDLYV